MRTTATLLLVLLFMCAQAQSIQSEVQTESQSTGTADAADQDFSQQDVSNELNELRYMVVELRVMLKYTQDELKVLEGGHAAMKERLVVSETKVEALDRELQDSRTEVDNLKKEHEAELVILRTRLTASESGIDDLNKEGAAQEAELTAVKARLADTETDVENQEKAIQEIKATPKVAFSAGLTNSGGINAGNTDLNLVFSRVITNVGQAYSNMNGFFTAPVRGVYYFRFTVMDSLSSRSMRIWLYKNGQLVMWLSDYDTDGNHTYLSSGLALQLEKGDQVNLRIPAGHRLYDNEHNHSTFSGFLIFPL